jgi:hypothetical protein
MKKQKSLEWFSLLGALVAFFPYRTMSQDQQNSPTKGSPSELAALMAKVEGLERELKELLDEKNRLKEDVFSLVKSVARAKIEKRSVEIEQERLLKMIARPRGVPGEPNPKNFPKDPIRFDAPRRESERRPNKALEPTPGAVALRVFSRVA